MKKIILCFTFCLTVLFSACTGGETQEVSPDNDTAITTDEAESSTSEESNIKFEYVSYETTFDWPSTTYEGSLYSFDVPADWSAVDGSDLGLSSGVYLVPSETDIDNFTSGIHIGIEFYNEPYDIQGDVSYYTSEDICKDFFSMRSIELNKLSALTNLDFYVWEREEACVYITEYERGDDTLTMDVTNYYVIMPDYYFVVYSITFGEDSEVPVHQAVCHLIDTFELS